MDFTDILTNNWTQNFSAFGDAIKLLAQKIAALEQWILKMKDITDRQLITCQKRIEQLEQQLKQKAGIEREMKQ
jgi:Mg2+ and Co2+ transporter CorA